MLRAEMVAANKLRSTVRAEHNAAVTNIVGAWDKQTPIVAIRNSRNTMSASIASSVLESRKRARQVALDRLKSELDQISKQLGRAGYDNVALQLPPQSDGVEDGALADAIGASFTSAWAVQMLSLVMKWADDPHDMLAAQSRDVLRALDFRIDRIATTETARAYNDEHDEGVGYAFKDQQDAEWLPAVLKRWDSTLDRAVCSTCKDHDGELEPIGIKFDNDDEPAEVHANCRCQDQLIFLPTRLPAKTEGEYVGLDEAAQ